MGTSDHGITFVRLKYSRSKRNHERRTEVRSLADAAVIFPIGNPDKPDVPVLSIWRYESDKL